MVIYVIFDAHEFSLGDAIGVVVAAVHIPTSTPLMRGTCSRSSSRNTTANVYSVGRVAEEGLLAQRGWHVDTTSS